MTRRTNAEIEEELDRLVALLVAHPGGLDSGVIRDEYARAYPNERELTERTLHRRLDSLEREGRLRAEGVRRWRRYLPVDVGPTPPDTTTAAQADGVITVPRTPPRHTHADAPPAGPFPADDPIPLSPEGEEVRSLVRRPLRDKATSIRYDETFLRSYMPGTTWYLPEPVRNRLH